ncbi:MAG: GtrA family protein [Clostridiaceae bacterium]|nr:GtrA family protein [Clostridiaceae bacterium]
MDTIRKLFQKNRQVILYLVFGGLTTLVNIAAYFVCARILCMNTLAANGLAWIVSVVFAYVTNKLFVFESKTEGFVQTAKECLSFVLCRLATGAMDMVIMYVSVDLAGFPDVIMKILSNILVIVLNFIFSKVIIFAKK